MDEEGVVNKKVELIKIKMEIEHQKKRLDWFDYQNGGGMFEGKTQEEISEDRTAIIDGIKELEKKQSDLAKSD